VKSSFAPTSPFPSACSSKHALRTARGQKIAYVVDAAYHEKNINRIVALARGADQLFMEAPSSTWMPKLLHKGDISPRVRPVASRSEQAFPDLSPSTSQARYRDHEDRLRCEAEQAFRE